MELWGRLAPGPTLVAKELPEMFRDETDGVLDDTEEAKEALRYAPASVVPFIDGLASRELEGVGAMAWVSPARSANVLRLDIGSATTIT